MNLTKYLVSNSYGPKMRMVFLLIWIFIVGTQSATMKSQLQMEANAIMNSGWWNTSDAYFNISNLCKWLEIICNKAGSIKEIYKYSATTSEIHFTTLNLSVFQNLERLVVQGVGLQGIIPKEIGLLSKLTYIDMSYNDLEGEIPHSLGNLTVKETIHL
ncbi:putative non-specific serine/threonine protein kinase [Medicago truncatula]|uniref:Putative non-specific serine/threonine protein kinase n=1 Tax=Medicago truncatula TaxID=3880 RepID=A0A396GUX2_MEDTR|nr:putative non-specific serine/threonine protein kinase [Medicago truncatula]